MITIIVPIYNTIKYLKQCLDSIKNQTFLDWEALLIDDGSTDGCSELAREYCQADERFKFLGGTHIGFPRSKNLGLDNVKGDFICFIDSDDYVEPDYLQSLYNTLISTNVDIVCCRYYVFSDNRPILPKEPTVITIFQDDKWKPLFSNKGASFMWNKLYKKEIFTDMRFDDVMCLSDTMLCYKLFEKAHHIACISDILINHRIHNENMTYRVHQLGEVYIKHRLNIYIDMCYYLTVTYPNYAVLFKQVFNKEWSVLLSRKYKHLYEEYLKNSKVQLLLRKD